MLKQIDKYTLKWPTSIMGRVQSPWKPWKDAITKLKGILARNVTNEKQWGKSLPADLVFICVVENPSWGVSKNFQQPELRLRIGPYIVVWSKIQNQMAQNSLTKGSMTSGERLATHGCSRETCHGAQSWNFPALKLQPFLGLQPCTWLHVADCTLTKEVWQAVSKVASIRPAS